MGGTPKAVICAQMTANFSAIGSLVLKDIFQLTVHLGPVYWVRWRGFQFNAVFNTEAAYWRENFKKGRVSILKNFRAYIP